ncbi:hypothetical protein CUC44_07315 [Aeromonas lusitana]|uniref:Uncharacterized protein n=1 Tax=Aeromonas lusitana TaxID=931529 RepID=A0A2M8HB08_9GAMM|nr:hypothetical protein CUC44_07315 [Aeromonas lusitana]
MVVTSNFFFGEMMGYGDGQGSAGIKKGPGRGAQTLETHARARIPSLVREMAGHPLERVPVMSLELDLLCASTATMASVLAITGGLSASPC